MRQGVEVINTIMDTLLEDKLPNDPDDRFDLEHMSVIISRMSGSRLGNMRWRCKLGSLTLPSVAEYFPNFIPDCVDNKARHPLYLS